MIKPLSQTVKIIVCHMALLALFMEPKELRAESVEQLARSVILFLNYTESGRNTPVGSGFLVSYGDGNKVVIVTADHVSRALYANWRLAVTSDEGKAWVLTPYNIKWLRSKTADVALAPLLVKNPKMLAELLERCLPAEYLTARPLPPSREIPLIAFGYPLGLFSNDNFSPITIDTKAASGILLQPRFDNGKPAKFIFLQQPSIGGLSGGPVLDTGGRYLLSNRSLRTQTGVSIVGLMHGTRSDTSGGKLAAVVPSTEIDALLKKLKN